MKNRTLNMIGYSVIASFALFLTACGGGGSSETPQPTQIELVENQPVMVEKGWTLEKTSESTEVQIETDLTTGQTQVILLTGNAVLKPTE
ncbi:hypothetical protein [Thiomicrorhabdus indica]|uniref:hypothetical protein n=1 Tax=Thiomicrorhabdus indica TaxID=2267253 RepID=UPI002AA780FA|nr:hypothetical protein [Thiomicrorhabdus indica]